jgi:hypothetical protein
MSVARVVLDMVARSPFGECEEKVDGVEQNHHEEHGESEQHSATDRTRFDQLTK